MVSMNTHQDRVPTRSKVVRRAFLMECYRVPTRADAHVHSSARVGLVRTDQRLTPRFAGVNRCPASAPGGRTWGAGPETQTDQPWARNPDDRKLRPTRSSPTKTEMLEQAAVAPVTEPQEGRDKFST